MARADLGLFMVADGLGGYEGGEVASRCVVEAFSGFCERVAHGPEATWEDVRPVLRVCLARRPEDRPGSPRGRAASSGTVLEDT